MSERDEVSSEDGANNLFEEPKDFYKPEPEATKAIHRLRDGREMSIRLVGHNPLWGHHLWNAGRCIADFIEDNAVDLVANKNILELGAGGGLPSLVAAIHGARTVVVTDYPDADLIQNLQHNIESCTLLNVGGVIQASGYLWGASTAEIKASLPVPEDGFDLLILADLLFNHSEHQKLVLSVQQTLARRSDAKALVFFTPYRPWLLQKDLAFFDLAAASGFTVEQIYEHVMDKVMFEEDPGDELIRRTVFGYRVRWAQDQIPP